jgi:hypothetical protein
MLRGVNTNTKRFIINNGKTDINNALITSFNVYPNPTDGHFFIDLTILLVDNTSIQITDVRGSLIKTINITKNSNNVSVNTKSWQDGVYFVSLFNGDQLIKTTKVVVK